jgi:uncharacterized membrane protein
MIQRIQSLWLLLAAAAAFAGFKFSYFIGTNVKGFSPYELKAGENFLLMLCTTAIGALALFTIFLYKNRKAQFWLCLAGILLEALCVFLYNREMATFKNGTYSLTAIIQMIVVAAFFLAAKGIRKDSKMVKDSDRLR